MSRVLSMMGRIHALLSAPRDFLRRREVLRKENEEARRREIEQERAALYHDWFPRLREYAEECRRRSPLPDVSQYSAVEREQHRILREAMQNKYWSTSLDIVLRRRSHQVPVLWTSRVGLPAAHELFGDTGAVILEESEQRDWFYGVYELNQRDWGFWWFAFAWWTLSETFSDEERKQLEPAIAALPAGTKYWGQHTGVQWGELQGGARGSLWRWDGTRAEFAGNYYDEDY